MRQPGRSHGLWSPAITPAPSPLGLSMNMHTSHWSIGST